MCSKVKSQLYLRFVFTTTRLNNDTYIKVCRYRSLLYIIINIALRFQCVNNSYTMMNGVGKLSFDSISGLLTLHFQVSPFNYKADDYDCQSRNQTKLVPIRSNPLPFAFHSDKQRTSMIPHKSECECIWWRLSMRARTVSAEANVIGHILGVAAAGWRNRTGQEPPYDCRMRFCIDYDK